MPGPAGILRWGARGSVRRNRVIVGATYVVRARWRTPIGTFSPWSGTVDFGVSVAGSIPIAVLVPLPQYIWSQPLTQWTYFDADGDAQTDYQLQIASDAAFSSLEFDSGIVTSKVLSYQHSGLSAATHYRRLRVRTAGTDWSTYTHDSFVLQTASTQTTVLDLFRVHWDDLPATAPQRSKIYVPVTNARRTVRLDGPGEFSFTPNAFRPFVERGLVSCWHFDEVAWAGYSPWSAHDIVARNDLQTYNAGSRAEGVWTNAGLNCSTLMYAYGTIASWVLDADFTVYFATITIGTTSGFYVLGIASSADNLNYYGIQNQGSGLVRLTARDAANSYLSSTLSVASGTLSVLCLKRNGATTTLTNLTTGVSQSVTTPHPTGAARLGVGCLPVSTVSYGLDGPSCYGALLYNVVTTAAEDARNLAAFKSALIWRGVTL